MATKVKRNAELPTNAVKPIQQRVDDMIEQESMIREHSRGAIPAQAAEAAIEDFGHCHGGACAAPRCAGQADMRVTGRNLFDSVAYPARLAIDLAVPSRCPACGVITMADHLFCVACWQKLDFLDGPACRSCGEPFPLNPGVDAQCGNCLAHPPAIDGMRAAVAYGEIARTLALKLKYGGRPGVAITLARQMRRLLPESDRLLTPVPLHRWRIWGRGFNQAALIGRALARLSGQEFIPDLLIRTKSTPVLRGMGPVERRKAVRGAFAVSPRRTERIKGRDIVLVDDVYTTGATVNACAAALKRAGAASVVVCCWSRVVRNIDNGEA